MRRTTLLATVVIFLLPAAAQGQIRLLGGVGVTNPMGDLKDVASVGWHAMGGVQLGIAAVPIGLRADGGYHSFGQQGSNPTTSVLSGALSVVVNFPGVGLSPYVLGGIGSYRTSLDVDGVDPVTNTGVHGAFGVDNGAVGFGGFAEVRYVSVKTDGDANERFVTATLGIRL
jgi:hypothetical protein